MLCLTFLLHQLVSRALTRRCRMKLVQDEDKNVPQVCLSKMNPLVTEVCAELRYLQQVQEVEEDPCEIRPVTSAADYKSRRRSSSRVHYRRNVRRIVSDCRRAKRWVKRVRVSCGGTGYVRCVRCWSFQYMYCKYKYTLYKRRIKRQWTYYYVDVVYMLNYFRLAYSSSFCGASKRDWSLKFRISIGHRSYLPRKN